MKFLNLTGFKFAALASDAAKVFINADHIISITVRKRDDGDSYTSIVCVGATYVLEGSVTEPIMFQLTGKEA